MTQILPTVVSCLREGLQNLRSNILEDLKFAQSRRLVRKIFQGKTSGSAVEPKKVLLFVCPGATNFSLINLCYLRAFQIKGYQVVVVAYNLPKANRYYTLLQNIEIVQWHQFFPSVDEKNLAAQCGSVFLPKTREECRGFAIRGINIGAHILAQIDRDLPFASMKSKRVDRGTFDQQYGSYLRWGVQAVLGCESLLAKWRPQIVWCADYYINGGTLIDVAVQKGINTFFTCHINYRPEFAFAKRYVTESAKVVYQALSDATWDRIQHLPWTEEHSAKLLHVYQEEYAKGRWNVHWKMDGRESIVAANRIRDELRLEPGKKVVFVCPPILWDSTTYSGEFFFDNFEQWFVDVLRLASRNDTVQWVIKIHPGNGEYNKNKQFWAKQNLRFSHGSMELDVLKREWHSVPSHVRILDFDSRFATCSCFPVMDVCLTISNFVALEAACHGVPTITPGRNYYSDKGFTIDARSKDEYLEMVGAIRSLNRLGPRQCSLAQKYMYALLHLKAFKRHSFQIRPAEGLVNTPWIHPTFTSPEEFARAKDIWDLIDWISAGEGEDYLNEEAMRETWPELFGSAQSEDAVGAHSIVPN